MGDTYFSDMVTSSDRMIKDFGVDDMSDVDMSEVLKYEIIREGIALMNKLVKEAKMCTITLEEEDYSHLPKSHIKHHIIQHYCHLISTCLVIPILVIRGRNIKDLYIASDDSHYSVYDSSNNTFYEPYWSESDLRSAFTDTYIMLYCYEKIPRLMKYTLGLGVEEMNNFYSHLTGNEDHLSEIFTDNTFQKITNPTYHQKKLAIRAHSRNIFFINDPTPELISLAISQDST